MIDELLSEIHAVAELDRRQRERLARRLGHTRPAWDVLKAAKKVGGTVPQLARALRSSRQNVQQLCDRLAERGFVRYEANPNHKRSLRVALTDAGRSELSALESAFEARRPELDDELEPEELETALTVIRTLGAAL